MVVAVAQRRRTSGAGFRLGHGGALLSVVASTLLTSCNDGVQARSIKHCGSGALQIRDGRHRVALLSCSGMAGLLPLPQITLRPGRSGVVPRMNGPAGDLNSQDTTVVRVRGRTVVAEKEGFATITLTGGPS